MPAAPPWKERWIYCSTNLLTDSNVEKLDALFHRAARDGYNGVLLSDYKFGLLPQMDAHYFQNVEKVKRIAADAHLEIVPAVFPIGYSNSLLSQDPNLAEGLPVRDEPLVVQGGVARLVPDAAAALKGTNFADFAGWKFHDDTVAASNGCAQVTDPAGRNARVMQTVKTHPFRQYHLAVDVRTQNVAGTTPQVVVLGKNGLRLTYSNLGVERTQDWKTCHMVFNSLESEEVNLYLGSWGMTTGTVQWRNPRLEESPLLNVVRRAGAPLEVRTEDGRLLEEGKDFAPVVDPRMGTVPWQGSYEVWHEPPVIHTSLPEGTRLRLSYYHAITVYDGQVMICPSEPKTVDLLRDQARRMHAAWHAKGYFMSHDEVRVLNQDKACADRHLDAGPLLAENLRVCTRILREVNPGGDIYVWSDMFDPTHNARKDYFLVRGDLANSWRGLDRDVKVMLWNFDGRAEGLKFFAGLGNPLLIAGYYDAPLEQMRQWLEAAKAYPQVEGVMYTTWEDNYKELEGFAKVVGEER